jgi:hypothetical protein
LTRNEEEEEEEQPSQPENQTEIGKQTDLKSSSSQT